MCVCGCLCIYICICICVCIYMCIYVCINGVNCADFNHRTDFICKVSWSMKKSQHYVKLHISGPNSNN